ncbi:MAG TPA: SCP2 sterol-binding domain-containing protein [Thermomonospora sp.]|nr:SCP2 sterol-binding domain-containing protein [Thermomonospora sp.]
MADLTNLRDIEDLDTLLDQLSGNDLRTLLQQVEPADLATVADKISTPGELKRLLEVAGGDEGLINEFIARAGVDVMLDRVFALMGTRFVSDRLGSDSGVVQWDIKTPDGERHYHLTIADGKAEGAKGPAAGNPRLTLAMSAYDLLQLCAGTMGGATGFMTGKIKLRGDMMFGAKLPSVFDTTAD